MWSITSKAALLMNGSSQPKTSGTRIRWADEEIGRNSVSPCTIPRTIAWRTVSTSGDQFVSVPVKALADEEGGEDEADSRQKLYEDVQRRAGGVLERVTDRVADDSRGVGLRALAENIAVVILEMAGLDVLLGVV